MDGGDDGEGIIGKSLPVHVADLFDGILGDLGNIHVAIRGQFAHHEHHARGRAAFDRRARVFVVGQHRVQHRVRDLVADLVGMPFRYAFARKKFVHFSLIS